MCRLLGEAVVAGEAVGDGAAPCEPGVDEVGAGDAIGE